MSLLLQALQKAAKTREDGQGETSGGEPLGELTLDDDLGLAPMQEEPTLRDEMDGPAETPAATPEQAATVVQAGRAEPGFNLLDYAREHYMLVFLAAAVLFAVIYGTYVYLQVARPFSSPPAPPPVAAQPVPPAPAPAPAEPAKITGLPESVAPSTAAPVATPAPIAANASGKEPAIAEKAGAEKSSPPATPETRIERVRPKSSRPLPAGKPTAVRAPQGNTDPVETVEIPATRASGQKIVRKDGSDLVPVDATLAQAYAELTAGNDEKARALYQEVLDADPKSIDALLGLGAIAWRQGNAEVASKHFQQVLQLDPRNSYAQAGLIAIVGMAAPEASESRLKQLIARDPSAFLHFTLGNLYAEREMWAAAQQSYFQAFQMQSDSPDYAFNLAVGLEHLGQEKLALGYYRKALDLSFKRGHANFDQNLVIQRVAQLSARVER